MTKEVFETKTVVQNHSTVEGLLLDDMNGEGTWIFIEIPENKKSLPTDIKKGIWNGMKLIEEK